MSPVRRSSLASWIRLLRSGLAFNYGVQQLTGIAGPTVGGLLIAAVRVPLTYGGDAVSCLAMLAAALAIAPQRPVAVAQHPPARRAVADGLRFVVANRALSGSFAINLVAMTFGMPWALFAVLALTVSPAGASRTGFLYRRSRSVERWPCWPRVG